MAERHQIPRSHAMKVVNGLAKAGLLTTTRGRGGGFMLARPPETISLGEVVRLTEPDLRPADCDSCVFAAGCGLTPILASAVRAFLAELDSKSLAQAAAESRAPFPLAPAGG